ncbi:MAG: hypothetical protein ACTHJM_05515 [Marmoricola sp.]
MLICPNGHEVDGGVAFCRQCGAPLAPQEEPTVVLPLAVTPPPTQQPAPRAARHPQSNTAVYVLAGVIVLIGLVGIGLALLLGSNDNTGGPTPVSQDTVSTQPSSSPSARPHHKSSAAKEVAVPVGGTKCPGTVTGGGEFGTIGSETSCGFVQAVYSSYVNTAGPSQPQGQTTTVTATSPATGRTYTNIVCTVGTPWVTCVGGNNNTARMFFAHP